MQSSLATLLKDDRDSTPLTGAALIDRLIEDWPDLDAAQLTVEEEREPGTLALRYAGTAIAVSVVPSPLDADLDALAAGSGQWPATVAPPHECTAFVVVAVLDADERGTHRDALARAVLLSRTIASMLHLDESLRAVFWSAADQLIHPANFLEQAGRLPAPMPASWVAITVGPRQDGTVGGYSRGLGMLGLLDLELPSIDETEDQVFDRLVGLALHQLERGPVLGDGETIAGPAGDVMVVRHTESADGAGRPVARLTPVPQRRRGLFGRRR